MIRPSPCTVQAVKVLRVRDLGFGEGVTDRSNRVNWAEQGLFLGFRLYSRSQKVGT